MFLLLNKWWMGRKKCTLEELYLKNIGMNKGLYKDRFHSIVVKCTMKLQVALNLYVTRPWLRQTRKTMYPPGHLGTPKCPCVTSTQGHQIL